MGNTNNLILNRIFTKNTFSQIVDNTNNNIYYSIIERYLSDCENKNNGEIISAIYNKISKEYRNEYFYKNTLLNKLLIGVHSVNTTVALTEIPINKSKADFIMINGKAVVYEIKTELDNLDRLENQINDYYKAFDHVCVLTNKNNSTRVLSKLKSSDVGIYMLTKNNTIAHIREPQRNRNSLDFTTMFKILRKNEFEAIVKEFYGYLPNVTPVNYYDSCYEMLKEIEINKLYDSYIKQLKKRNIFLKKEFIKQVPQELKFIIYFSNYKNKDYIKLNKFLKQKRGC